MKTLSRLWADFVALLFPRLCLACENPLPYEENHLCLECQLTLPQTDFHLEKNNLFVERFVGRVPIEAGAALFYFTKKSRTQHLVHKIKYHDKREAATELGRMLGRKLMQSVDYQCFSAIIPVPMHPRKQILRGYNQAEMFANGLSEAMNIPVEKTALRKVKMTETQTKKNRFERLENIEDVFELANPSVLKGKNVLIVDDVMTTGATLEACAHAILTKMDDVKIGFATIAFAKR